jgi:glycylpeptide N-tetradecanoyltransferase
MSQESKEVGKQADKNTEEDVVQELQPTEEGEEDDASGDDEPPNTTEGNASGPAKKKKKSKKKKLKAALTGQRSEGGSSTSKTLSREQLNEIIKNNPSLRNELGGMEVSKAEEMMKKLSMSDLLTGMVRLILLVD